LSDDTMKNMKQWASQPWETNIVHVGGLLMLEADTDLWAEKALTKFCPLAYSPGAAEYDADHFGYQHVKDSGWCGEKRHENILSKNVENAEQCAALAVGADKQSFMLGAFFRRGWCIGGTMEVTEDQYKEWETKAGKVNPACTEAGGWSSSMLFDFFSAACFTRLTVTFSLTCSCFSFPFRLFSTFFCSSFSAFSCAFNPFSSFLRAAFFSLILSFPFLSTLT